MKFSRGRDHCAEFLFPLLLFVLLAFLTTEFVIFAANGYRKIYEKRSMNSEADTCINYVRKKIHQNDSDGGVEIADLAGNSALVLRKNISGKIYLTYIYAYKGEIRELFTQENASVTPESGTAIMKVSDFRITQPGERLFCFSCTDAGGMTAESYVCIRSKKLIID